MWSDLTLRVISAFKFGYPRVQGQTRIAKLKSAYNSLIIGPRGLGCETNILEIMSWESFGVSDFTLHPSFKVK